MSKAQVFALSSLLELILIGLFGITLASLLLGGYANVNQIVMGNDNERHALTLANIFSSHPDIVYFDGYQSHRAVIDKVKLDEQMTKKKDFIADWKEKLYPNLELSKNFSYPDSYTVIITSDLEADYAWITTLNGTAKGFNLDDFLSCLRQNINPNDIPKLFELDSNLHEILKIEKCKSLFYSKILDYGFPVAVRYSDNDIHAGLVKVLVVEW